MTITLPEVHRRWLEELAARNGLTVDKVIAQLIEEAWESDEVEAQMLAAVNGAPAEPMTRADWDRLRKRLADRAATALGE
jgi:hypothetical protein